MIVNKETGELFLYGVVADGYFEGCFDDLMVIEALAELGDTPVIARINSPGGSVDLGVSIKNALQRHAAGCTVVVDGLAASIASYIMLAGESLTFASGSRAMIHSPWTFAMGSAVELRKTAETLDTYERSLLPEYASAMGISEDDVKSLLDDETWYTAGEAVEAFGTAKLDDKAEAKPAAKIAAGVFKNTPKDLVVPSDYAQPHYRGIAAFGMRPRIKAEEPKPNLSAVEKAAAVQNHLSGRITSLTSER